MRQYFCFLIFLYIIQHNGLQAQDSTGLHIHLKEFHTEDVTNIVVLPGGEFYISADASGRIIMYKTEDHSFYKLIASGKDRVPIKDIQLIHNNESLLVSKGYDFYVHDTLKADSIVVYSIENNAILYSFPFSSKIHKSSNDSVLVYSVHDWNTGTASLHGTDKQSFPSEDLFRLNVDTRLEDASYSPDGIVAYTEHHFSTKKLKLYDVKEQLLLYEEVLENVDIILSFYDRNDAGFYIFSLNTDDYTVSIYFINILNYSKKKVTEFKSFTHSPSIYSSGRGNERKIIITPNNDYTKDNFIITKNNTGFDIQLISTANGSAAGAFIPETNELIFWDKFNSFNDNVASFTVYDAESYNLIGKFPAASNYTFRGFYIPGNDWIISGRDLSQIFNEQHFGTQLKHFRAGTFDNRFGMLNFEDYLNIHHKIKIANTTDVLLDLKTGVAVFTGGRIKDTYISSAYEAYYNYNFKTDKVEKISDQAVDFIIPIGYNHRKKRLLLGDGRYYENSHGGQKIKLVDRDKTTELKGEYKNVALSNDGSLLLKISSENVLEISDLDLNETLLDTILAGGTFKVFPVDENNFFINISKPSVMSGECRDLALSLEWLNESFKTETIECYHFDDITGRAGNVAFIIKNFGFAFNDKLHPVKGSDRPLSLTLNDDASQMMVNFQSGKINIYSTKDFSILGSMFHPNRKSHFFVDKDNNYFSNIDAEEYIYAEENGSVVPLSKIGDKYFRPDRILHLLSKPNPDYLKTIQRALAIRKNKISPVTGMSDDNAFKIKRILIDGSSTKNHITDKENIAIQFDYRSTDESLLSIHLNNVHIKDLKLDPSDSAASFSLPLVDSVNALKFTLKDRKAFDKSIVEKSVICKAPFPKPDLYLLSIGVSNYKQEGYDLTFADKDAIEMGSFYGNLESRELNRYRQKFFGRRIQLYNNDSADIVGEIREFEGAYSSVLKLFPGSESGEIWVDIEGKNARIWNFENSSIDSISLPAGFSYDSYSMEDPIIPAPGKEGFYLNPPGRNLYFYSFSDKKFTKSKLPFTKEEITSLNVAPLEDKRWLKAEINYVWNDTTSADSVLLIIAKPENDTWSYDSSSFILWGSSNAELRGVSADGKHFLFSDYADKFWYVKNNSNGFLIEQIKAAVKPGYDDRFYFNNNSTSFSILQYDYDKVEFNFHVINLKGEIIHSSTLENADYSIAGVSNYNSSLNWIRISESLAKQPNLFSDDDKWSTYKPASFNKIYTQVLTDDLATSEAIRSELNNFFKNAGLRDQLMIFVAGHGVLDDSLNYYYAPYDMNFHNVSEKGISLTEILQYLQNSPSTRKLLMMDACHSGNVLDFTSDINMVSHSGGQGERGATVITSAKENPVKVSDVVNTMFDNFMSGSGITILSASSGTDVAYENRELSNGAFTSAYMEILKNEISGNFSLLLDENRLSLPVDLNPDIIYQIQKRVIEMTNGKQLPDVREINEKARLKIW